MIGEDKNGREEPRLTAHDRWSMRLIVPASLYAGEEIAENGHGEDVSGVEVPEAQRTY
jgi:hypothetical protein